MAKVIEVPFGGGMILFEAAEPGGPRASSASDVLAKAADSLEDAVETVKRVDDAFAQQLSQLAYDSAELSLGVKMSGKGKFIVAEASGEASLSVKIKFKPAKP